jgi:hypothetical protein
MPSESGNLPEQEISIKSRAHEVFAKPKPEAAGVRQTKPFPVYLRETPAFPMSSTVKAMLWFAGIIVGLLFLAAVWKLTVRHGPRRLAPAPRVSARGDRIPGRARGFSTSGSPSSDRRPQS